ncbi:MAG: DUF6051 family protein [Lentimicrobium sp.]|jgi:pimeloyl-ACP methyl ester carboxylesterase|nr:DUF6051 family protein [Lentimicrobium sp.]
MNIIKPTVSYTFLAEMFKHGMEGVCLADNDMLFNRYDFLSTFPAYPDFAKKETESEAPLEDVPDHMIEENLKFTYPVIYPSHGNKFQSAIILLHGLNERSWNKYLPWAYRLALMLQRPVIMFPLSFHMNRAPSAWSNPRLMSALLPETRLRNHRNQSSTFVNLAISLRLSRKPLRFITSGCQSLNDILNLADYLKSGNHPIMEKDSKIDYFAYSIGAFLVQIMMLTYGDSILRDSRAFLFCGGASFNRMNGVSKLIMDEEAFIRLKFYYLKKIEREIKNRGPMAEYICTQPWGQAFRAMIGSSNFFQWREDSFKRLGSRIYAIGMVKDKVIPASYMSELLAPEQMEIIDFPYYYTHENPFPLQANPKLVNEAFDTIIGKAISFLA